MKRLALVLLLAVGLTACDESKRIVNNYAPKVDTVQVFVGGYVYWDTVYIDTCYGCTECPPGWHRNGKCGNEE